MASIVFTSTTDTARSQSAEEKRVIVKEREANEGGGSVRHTARRGHVGGGELGPGARAVSHMSSTETFAGLAVAMVYAIRSEQ